MLSEILIVFLGLNIVYAKQDLIKFDEEILNKLQISSTSISYDEFELSNNYQCAIECFKDKNSCTGYVFDSLTKTCSLFNDPTKIIDNDLIELVKYRN